MNLTPMDYIRAALANAMAEDMSLEDVWRCVEHAETPAAFDKAINTLAQAQGEKVT